MGRDVLALGRTRVGSNLAPSKTLKGDVPNLVVRTHTDPLGKRAVLLRLLPQNLLHLESLVGRLRW